MPFCLSCGYRRCACAYTNRLPEVARRLTEHTGGQPYMQDREPVRNLTRTTRAHSIAIKQGWDPDHVYIGRPTKWGNPFPLPNVHTEEERRECVQAYAQYLFAHPDLLADAILELKGKTLWCWCAPKLCHGDVLAWVANEWKGE